MGCLSLRILYSLRNNLFNISDKFSCMEWDIPLTSNVKRIQYFCVNWLYRGISEGRIHERTISLRFLGIILRVLRLEVSVYNVDIVFIWDYESKKQRPSERQKIFFSAYIKNMESGTCLLELHDTSRCFRWNVLLFVYHFLSPFKKTCQNIM